LGKEFACQFLRSAKINIGTFTLPVKLGSSDEEYAAQTTKLATIIDLTKTLGGKRCCVPIETSSDTAFQPNFERHRLRLHDLGEKLGRQGIRVGVALQLSGPTEKPDKFIRTVSEIITLVKTVGQENVGLCLDTWHWTMCGGGEKQLADVNVKQLVELRLADVSSKTDPKKPVATGRVLAGDQPNSTAVSIFNHFRKQGYDGAVSFATDTANFSRVPRDVVVHRISTRLDKLIAGLPLSEDTTPPAKQPAKETESAVAELADAGASSSA
jgi:sugar phosphate isomerase/epimerase